MKYDLIGIMPIWLAKVIERIEYKPGWSLRIMTQRDARNEPWAYIFSAQCTVEDIVTKTPMTLHGGSVTIYREHMDEKLVVHLIFNVIRSLEYHEMEEQFMYNGIRIYDPHRNVREHDKLFELAAVHSENYPKAMSLVSKDLMNFERLPP